MAVYLIMFGVMFGSMAASENEPGMWMFIMPLLMAIDFGTRFGVQQTPLMLVKPYMLLPLPSKSVIETFLLSSLMSGYNWLWLCFFLPYAVIVLAGGASIGAALVVVLSGMIIVMINSQWYLIIRTLVGRSLLWWLLPILVYALYFVPLVVFSKDQNFSLFDTVTEWMAQAGSQWWFVVACLLILAGAFLLSRWLQFRYVYEEISSDQKKSAALKSVSQFSFLERFGQAGEYLKLELKSAMRNKAVKTRVISSLVLITVLSLLIAYTDMYDSRMMLNFWCYYCFSLYGLTTLAKVMGPEGNYIDLLLTQRENILLLLKAKYYFHVCILFVPIILMLPAIIAGKFSPLMIMAYVLISSGLLFFILFQLAVYNKQTLPLDQKLTGKGNIENGLQTIVVLVAMMAPIAVLALFILIFNETTAYLVLAAVGLILTLLHPLWLRNIYNRMMVRKYENLEGFHATR